MGATPDDNDADSICTAIQKIYDDQYSSGETNGMTTGSALITVGTMSISGSGTLNCSSLSSYPNYDILGGDDFIIEITSVTTADISTGEYSNNWVMPCSTVTGQSMSKSYTRSTGTLTVVSPIASLSGRGILNGGWKTYATTNVTCTATVYITRAALGA